MGYYKNAQICLNGHIITNNISDCPALNEKFCKLCGARTITKCPNCDEDIRGAYHVEGVLGFDDEKELAPCYCFNCGQPFPWTEAGLEAAKIAIDEDENLKPKDKEKLKLSLKDLIADTPRTSLAVSCMKNAFLHIGNITKEVLMDFIVSLCCEAAKSKLGL